MSKIKTQLLEVRVGEPCEPNDYLIPKDDGRLYVTRNIVSATHIAATRATGPNEYIFAKEVPGSQGLIASTDWHALMDYYDDGGTCTAFFYGAVPNPDPYAGDGRFHPSQSIDDSLEENYKPAGDDSEKLHIEAYMRSGAPVYAGSGYDDIVFPYKVSPLGYNFLMNDNSPPEVIMGGTIYNINSTHFVVFRRMEDVNTDHADLYGYGIVGIMERVRFRIYKRD